MLTAKGYDVGFRLEKPNGVGRSRAELFAPKSYAMLHDPSGQAWPKCSVLIAPFTKGKEEIDNAEAKKYFGYPPLAGKIVLPIENLAHWSRVGAVKEIDYWRPGEYRGGWYHPFKGGGWIFNNPLPELFRKGRLLRLELGPGCKLSWRGFEYP